MKIVFLSHFDANLYLFRLPIMKALAGKGWEVIALTPEGTYSHRFEEEGIRHVSYEMDQGSLNPIKEVMAIRQIAEKLKGLAPDILHAFTVKPNIYGMLAGYLAGTKIKISSVTGLGSFFIEKDIKSRVIRTIITLLYQLVFRLADRVIFQNNDDLEVFVKNKIVSREKTVLIKGSGIDTTLWQKNDTKKTGKSVIFIGRLLIHKGVGEFIAAAREVKRHHKEVRFIIAGDFYEGNPYNIKKEQLTLAINEGVIEFVGWRQEIRPLLEEASIFVLPSYREGMPRTAIEAASMSLPIITTEAVGCKEVVEEGVNGFLVPVGESRLIVQRINELLEDQHLYEKMAANSRKKAVAEFDVSVIVDQHLALYSTLLEQL